MLLTQMTVLHTQNWRVIMDMDILTIWTKWKAFVLKNFKRWGEMGRVGTNMHMNVFNSILWSTISTLWRHQIKITIIGGHGDVLGNSWEKCSIFIFSVTCLATQNTSWVPSWKPMFISHFCCCCCLLSF